MSFYLECYWTSLNIVLAIEYYVACISLKVLIVFDCVIGVGGAVKPFNLLW